MVITLQQAERLGKHYNINFQVIPFQEWHFGLNVELEHGRQLGRITNVSRDSLKITARIAIAHLIEDPRYYHHLKKLEQKREKYWNTRVKPSIFRV